MERGGKKSELTTVNIYFLYDDFGDILEIFWQLVDIKKESIRYEDIRILKC